ncbi:hypothetical protein EVAR_18159_1 [Eumeta japonica]|uniref:Uncharacterized protein n=1 Tax=Eumeta variegata TaxID=151549 RepID=A0A4C1UVU9_EUMVA|nr:hypothetical protein EVAR_18159_1 [Eumeta japonica]
MVYARVIRTGIERWIMIEGILFDSKSAQCKRLTNLVQINVGKARNDNGPDEVLKRGATTASITAAGVAAAPPAAVTRVACRSSSLFTALKRNFRRYCRRLEYGHCFLDEFQCRLFNGAFSNTKAFYKAAPARPRTPRGLAPARDPRPRRVFYPVRLVNMFLCMPNIEAECDFDLLVLSRCFINLG